MGPDNQISWFLRSDGVDPIRHADPVALNVRSVRQEKALQLQGFFMRANLATRSLLCRLLSQSVLKRAQELVRILTRER